MPTRDVGSEEPSADLHGTHSNFPEISRERLGDCEFTALLGSVPAEYQRGRDSYRRNRTTHTTRDGAHAVALRCGSSSRFRTQSGRSSFRVARVGRGDKRTLRRPLSRRVTAQRIKHRLQAHDHESVFGISLPCTMSSTNLAQAASASRVDYGRGGMSQ